MILLRSRRLGAPAAILLLATGAGAAREEKKAEGRVQAVLPAGALIVETGRWQGMVALIGTSRDQKRDVGELHMLGGEPREFAAALLAGRKVLLQRDRRYRVRDDGIWASRYVFLEDGTLVNAEVIRRGYAFAETGEKYERAEEFLALEAAARRDRAGLWASLPSPQAHAVPPGENGEAPAQRRTDPVLGVTPMGIWVGEITWPRLVKQVTPKFPPRAIHTRKVGWVVAEATIGADGTLSEIGLVGAPASDPGFVDSVTEAMQQWRYEPARIAGGAVSQRFFVVVDFSFR